MASHFRLATPEDDDTLRWLLASISMEGSIALCTRQEPSYFIAEQAGNRSSQTMLYRGTENGQIVGLARRSIRDAYVDGNVRSVGYLSLLRGLPAARKGTGLARGFSYLHQLHADGQVPYYLTHILDENAVAQRVLTSGRAGLPVFEPVGQVATYLVALRRKRRPRGLDMSIASVGHGLLPAATECLRAWGTSHQFAPVYEDKDLAGETGLLPSFSCENLYVYADGKTALATLGVWDQRAFKQMVVAGYSPAIRLLRPIVNAFAQVKYPAVGGEVRMLYAAMLSVRDVNAEPFCALLARVCEDWSGRGYDYLAIGVGKGSLLEPSVARTAQRCFTSTAYVVHWPEERVVLPQRTLPLHLEIATL